MRNNGGAKAKKALVAATTWHQWRSIGKCRLTAAARRNSDGSRRKISAALKLAAAAISIGKAAARRSDRGKINGESGK